MKRSRRILGISLIGGILSAVSSGVHAGDLAGRAVRFDAVDDMIEVPWSSSLDSTREMTVEGWVFPATISQGGLFGMWGNGGLPDRYLLNIEAGQLIGRIVLDGVPGQVTVQTPIEPQRWVHVAMTHDSQRLSLFLNGSLVDSTPAAGTLPSVTVPFRMGIEDIAFGQPAAHLAGDLDEVRVWRVARSADQIACSYNEIVAPDSEGLVAQWSLDGGGQEVVDATALGNHGTLGIDALPGADDPLRVASQAPLRWSDRGQGLAGSFGVPRLCTRGTLIGGTLYSFEVSDARPNSTAIFVVGLSAIEIPFAGGTMVPSPDFIFAGLPIDPAGDLSLGGVWPAAVPPCTSLFFQFWIQDPAGPQGFSSTRGAWGQTP